MKVRRKPNKILVCEACGKSVLKYQRPSSRLLRFCSIECRHENLRGRKHSAEHIKKQSGENCNFWKGDTASQKAGRTRALRKFKVAPSCEMCGVTKSERHHIDGDTLNNDISSICFLCHTHHMRAHKLARAELKKAQVINAAKPSGGR